MAKRKTGKTPLTKFRGMSDALARKLALAEDRRNAYRAMTQKKQIALYHRFEAKDTREMFNLHMAMKRTTIVRMWNTCPCARHRAQRKALAVSIASSRRAA